MSHDHTALQNRSTLLASGGRWAGAVGACCPFNMKSTIFKVSGILVSLGSAIFGVYWIVAFVRSTSPDRGWLIAPLFFCGLPSTFIGNLVGGGLLIAGKEYWYYALLITCYFVQWQFVARWLYRKGGRGYLLHIATFICLCVLSNGCALTKTNTRARSPADVEKSISGALPAGWDIQSEQPTPNQHVREIKLVGPAPCWVGWKDKDGCWHEESVGREAITIMISTNRISVTLFQSFKGLYTPLLYDGGTVFVYAEETSSITNNQREAQIGKEAELYTGCGPSGEPTSYLPWSYVSWRNWRSDLKRSFGTMHNARPAPR